MSLLPSSILRFTNFSILPILKRRNIVILKLKNSLMFVNVPFRVKAKNIYELF